MIDSKLEMYENLDTVMPLIPKRSHYYPLEPIGIGSIELESLTSYMNRLAKSHCLLPGSLILKGFANNLQINHLLQGNTGDWYKSSNSLNGVCKRSQLFVELLEKLTLRKDIVNLTWLTWSNILHQKQIINNTKFWCVACYEEQKRNAQPIYDPLIWSLRVVEFCMKHEVRLINTCLNENCKRAIPAIHANSEIGMCPYCGQWLGTNNYLIYKIKTDYSWHKFVYSNIGDLTKMSITINHKPSSYNIIQNIKNCINYASNGNVKHFSRRLTTSPSVLYRLYRAQAIPPLLFLLKLCYSTNISLTDLIFNEIKNWELVLKSFKGDSIKTKQKVVLDLEKVKNALEQSLQSKNEVKISLEEFSRTNNVGLNTVKKYFPSLSKEISEKYEQYRKFKKTKRIVEICKEVREITINLYKSGVYPSINLVEKTATKSSVTRIPEVKAEWEATLRELGLTRKSYT